MRITTTTATPQNKNLHSLAPPLGVPLRAPEGEVAVEAAPITR